MLNRTHFSFRSAIDLRMLGALICLVCAYSPAYSDQNDPRLENLFAELLVVEEQQAGDAITDNIWEIWRDSGDPEINELMREGVSAMHSGRLRRAVRFFDQIIDKAPDFAEGWNKRATVYFFLREFENSAKDVRKTLMLEPRHFGATAGLGLIFLELEYYESALEAFEKTLLINPHLPGPRMQIERIKKILLDEPA